MPSLKSSTPEMQAYLDALDEYVDARIALDKVEEKEEAEVMCRQKRFHLKRRLLLLFGGKG